MMCWKPFLFVVALSGIGCAEVTASVRNAADDTVRTRAAFDLSCPASQLSLTSLSDEYAARGIGTVGVTGCGKKATYVATCQLTSCTALLQSEVGTPAAAPTPAPAPEAPAEGKAL